MSTLTKTATDAQLVAVTLQINGTDHALLLDPRVTLLDALREHLGLTGTKRGSTTSLLPRSSGKSVESI